MTDAEAAIERLTAWVRDYGDSKPQVFIGDVSMLLMIAKESQAKVEALQRQLQSLQRRTSGIETHPIRPTDSGDDELDDCEERGISR